MFDHIVFYVVISPILGGEAILMGPCFESLG